MSRTILAATVTGFALMASLPAHADQFAVRVNSEFKGATPELLSTLRITEVDNFAVGGNFYLILEAPDVAYVEAYVFAIHRIAVELHALDANWIHPTVAGMPIDEKIGFLRRLACSFCVS